LRGLAEQAVVRKGAVDFTASDLRMSKHLISESAALDSNEKNTTPQRRSPEITAVQRHHKILIIRNSACPVGQISD
jgi:hypothetical protein